MDQEISGVTLHGRRMAVRRIGAGPVVLMIHGLTGSMRTWDGVAASLARHCTVITPDLLGHGTSDPAAGDHSLGAHASSLRDLLEALGHDSVTVVGHSLGGGIAMQLAYQFPQLCDRLVLVSSGGLGTEVSPLLRAAALPGAELVLPLIAHRRVIEAGRTVGRLAAAIGVTPDDEIAHSAESFASLTTGSTRETFIHTLRSVIDHRGQRVSATDRLHLTRSRPCMIVWGRRDRIIPVAHAHTAHAALPHSRLELFDDAGHFPHRADPERFVSTLREFVDAPASPA